MADSNKTIRIDIIIDDKGTVKVKQLTDAVKALSKENKVAKDTQASLVQQIQKLQGASKRTADVIKKEIALTTKLNNSTKTTNKAYLEGVIGIQKLERELNDLTKTQSRVILSGKTTAKNLGNIKSATGSASGAVVELGRTISDSNYGFPAMANNVQQLATQMTFVVAEQGGVVKGFKAIGKAMTGAGGLLLLFTIGVALLERFSLKAREVKNEVKDLNGELAKRKGVLDNIKNLADIVDTSTDNIGLQELALKDLKEKGYDPLIGTLEDFIKLKEDEMLFEIAMQEFSKSKLDSLTKEEEIRTKIRDVQAKLSGDIQPETAVLDRSGRQRVVKSASQIRSELEAELTNLETSLAVNGVNIAIVNERIKQSYEDLADSIKDNPFTKSLIFGGEGKGEGDTKDTEDELDSFMQRIREKAEEQKLKGDEQALLALERERALSEARALGAEEGGEEILEIQRYYGDLAFELYNEQNDRFKEKREADAEERLNAELKGHRQRLKLEKQSIKAKEKVQMEAVKFANVIANLMTGIDERSKTLKVLSFILEKGSAIASVLIKSNSSISQQKSNTNAANSAVRLKYAGIPGGAAAMKAEITANNLAMIKGIGQTKTSSALSIASILATSLKSNGGSTPSDSATSSTGGGEATTTQPPDFNIVGQSETNQLAQTIALSEEQPLRAYVVAEDVTTAQQLDNSIIQGASLG